VTTEFLHLQCSISKPSVWGSKSGNQAGVLTGLFWIAPPSMRVPLTVPSTEVKKAGGKYVGAAAVARHTSHSLHTIAISIKENSNG
jgi:hypothetical protein